MGGLDQAAPTGTYGTEGTLAATNTPGARVHAASWTDGSGNLLLFGGNTPDSAPVSPTLGIQDYRNDLWQLGP